MSTTCRSADDILDHAKQPKTDKQSADRAHFRHLSVVGFPPIFAVGSTQGTGDLASTAGSTPASMVGSIVPASEVWLLLLVPTSKSKTQIKCAKEILRYLALHCQR